MAKPSKIIDNPHTPIAPLPDSPNTPIDPLPDAGAGGDDAVSVNDTNTVAPKEAAPAAPVGVAGVGAVKEGNVVKLASGERRVDYIKRRFGEGATRGTIAKELGVAYQIVFAATKKPKVDATAGVAAVVAAANAPAVQEALAADAAEVAAAPAEA